MAFRLIMGLKGVAQHRGSRLGVSRQLLLETLESQFSAPQPEDIPIPKFFGPPTSASDATASAAAFAVAADSAANPAARLAAEMEAPPARFAAEFEAMMQVAAANAAADAATRAAPQPTLGAAAAAAITARAVFRPNIYHSGIVPQWS